VRELQGLFASYGFNAFPVVDDAGALVGIVTKLDLLRIFRPDRARLRPGILELWAERVDDIMRRRVVTLAPGDDVTTASSRTCAASPWSSTAAERISSSGSSAAAT
jgi:CBS domain-containing protein